MWNHNLWRGWKVSFTDSFEKLTFINTVSDKKPVNAQMYKPLYVGIKIETLSLFIIKAKHFKWHFRFYTDLNLAFLFTNNQPS